MTLRELVERNRSFRRFDESKAISRETLLDLVDHARLAASAANRQPLRYHLACDPAANAAIFPCLAWAAYLADWDGPAPGERPAAYLVMCVDTDVAKDWWCDDGIAAQTILLRAAELGLGGCMIGAIRQEELRRTLALPERLKIRLVLALGVPAETVRLEPLPPDGSIRYWRDEAGVHHVPKRPLAELLLN